MAADLVGRYTVAKHEAFALLRAAKREQPVDEVWPRVTALAPDELLATRKVLALIDPLKPQQRTVLRLRIAGLSFNEMSSTPGRPTPGSTATSPRAGRRCGA